MFIRPKFQYNTGMKNYHNFRADGLEKRALKHREKADKHLTWILEREAETNDLIKGMKADIKRFERRHNALKKSAAGAAVTGEVVAA